MATKRLIQSITPLRLEVTQQWVSKLSSEQEILILAPTKGAADDFARRLSLRTGGVLGLHRMTVAQLAAALATSGLAERKLAPLSPLAAQALAARCVHLWLKQEAATYFGPVATMPGFSRAVASTISELRLEAIEPEMLVSIGEPGPDLVSVQELFQRELEAKALADLAMLFRLATNSVREGKSYLLGLPLLLLDIAPRSALEKDFIARLAAQAPSVMATALRGDAEGCRTLEELLGVSAEELDHPKTAMPPRALDCIRQYLFTTQNVPERDLDESLEFFSAPGQGRECVEIARRIVEAAARGVAFDQIAVLLRNPDLYQPALEDALHRGGIPAYFSRGTVRPDPAGRAFLALLACAEEKLSASRFAEYLSLGQVPPLDDAGGPHSVALAWVSPDDDSQLTFKADLLESDQVEPEPIETHESPVVAGSLRTPLHWERLLVDAAVIGGKDRWVRRLNGLEQELKLQIQSAEEDTRQMQLQNQLERLAHLKHFAIPVIESLDRLPRQGCWGEWLEPLRRLAGMTLRQPESVLAVLAELEPMSEVGPVELIEVRETLMDRLTFLRREPPETRYGRVFVGTVAEAAARYFEQVFLPGLAEGIFPRKTLEDPLLLDSYRQKLPGTLKLNQDRAEQERLLLRMAAGAARRQLVISYPRLDIVEGRARVPSLYALELLRAASGRLPDLKSLQREAAQAAHSRLGWPAPRDTAQAIDDAEYDLSLLDPLLHERNQPIKGQGRFLVEVNPHLARSLRSRSKRWRPKWYDSDGIVDPDAKTLKALQTHRLLTRAYSATSLQSYAACPYRFLLQGIYHLRPREAATAIEQMDPLTRGGLFHAVQFRLFEKFQAEGLLPMNPESMNEILKLTDQVLDAVAGEYHEMLAPAIPRIWEGEIEDLRVDVRGWIREVMARDRDWSPIHYEFSFGLPLETGRDPASCRNEAVIANGVRLRGSIDLVEQHGQQQALRVTDHKTGKMPASRVQWVGRGEVLQPLLYGLAAQSLLEGMPVQSARLFYCTQRGGFGEQIIALDEIARRTIQTVTDTIDLAIETGFLPAAPREGACQFCDFRQVCGPYEELRTRRKPRKPLERLEEIRKTP